MKTRNRYGVKLKSGARGWRGRLQDQYASMEEFLDFDAQFNLSLRLGFELPEQLWEANPVVEGGTDPADYRMYPVNPPEVIEKIAQRCLGVKTLEARGGDSDDFHDLPVWNLSKALLAAYWAGTKHKNGRKK